jgi:phosphoglycolate phosphatase-like HAD superfamily hydrolase
MILLICCLSSVGRWSPLHGGGSRRSGWRALAFRYRHPDGYLAAAARLGIEPAECLVFEDAPAGIEAGMAAGMNVVGIKTTFSHKDLRCEWCIDDFRAISLM